MNIYKIEGYSSSSCKSVGNFPEVLNVSWLFLSNSTSSSVSTLVCLFRVRYRLELSIALTFYDQCLILFRQLTQVVSMHIEEYEVM